MSWLSDKWDDATDYVDDVVDSAVDHTKDGLKSAGDKLDEWGHEIDDGLHKAGRVVDDWAHAELDGLWQQFNIYKDVWEADNPWDAWWQNTGEQLEPAWAKALNENGLMRDDHLKYTNDAHKLTAAGALIVAGTIYGGPVGYGAAVGAAGAMGLNYKNQKDQGGSVDWGEVGMSGVEGGVVGGVGGYLGGSGLLGGALGGNVGGESKSGGPDIGGGGNYAIPSGGESGGGDPGAGTSKQKRVTNSVPEAEFLDGGGGRWGNAGMGGVFGGLDDLHSEDRYVDTEKIRKQYAQRKSGTFVNR